MKISPRRTRAIARGLALAAVGCAASVSHAALLSRIDGFYDTVLDISWTAHANGVAGTPFDDGLSGSDGFATWNSVNSWLSTFTLQGVGGWRLPTMDTGCLGYGCSSASGELGYMFHVNLGGTAGSGVGASPFTGLVNGNYWSSTDYPFDPEQAGAFDFSDGNNNYGLKDEPYAAAWAVHDGDVLPVPEPASVVMLLAGLAVLAGRRLHR